MFSLRRKGARPIPDPELLMAHHDKVMMELLRSVLLAGTSGQPAAHAFGTFEELEARSRSWTQWPGLEFLERPESVRCGLARSACQQDAAQ